MKVSNIAVSSLISMAAVAVSLVLAGCGEAAKMPPEATIGPRPQLAEPNKTLIPTVNVATAVGWSDTAGPKAADGLRVNALARACPAPTESRCCAMPTETARRRCGTFSSRT